MASKDVGTVSKATGLEIKRFRIETPLDDPSNNRVQGTWWCFLPVWPEDAGLCNFVGRLDGSSDAKASAFRDSPDKGPESTQKSHRN